MSSISVPSDNDERRAQLQYWTGELKTGSYTTPDALMLLDPKGEAYSSAEVAGTLKLLPVLPAGSLVVELAAGAGRITPHLARLAGKVIANDFVPEFIAMNKARCESMGVKNVEFRTGDAAEFSWPAPGATYLVFINWLLMYLNDDSAQAVLRQAVSALTHRGCLFLHESADDGEPLDIVEYQPWSVEYPARYRHHAWYRKALTEAARPRGEFTLAEFDLAGLYSEAGEVQPAWLLRLK